MAARNTMPEEDSTGSGIESTGEAHYRAELFRSRGELERHRADDEAEAHFEQALTTARRQGIKPFEPRAAASIARPRRGQGKANEAHDQITPIYDRFTEGFDTPDLKDAKAFLDELARVRLWLYSKGTEAPLEARFQARSGHRRGKLSPNYGVIFQHMT